MHTIKDAPTDSHPSFYVAGLLTLTRLTVYSARLEDPALSSDQQDSNVSRTASFRGPTFTTSWSFQAGSLRPLSCVDLFHYGRSVLRFFMVWDALQRYRNYPYYCASVSHPPFFFFSLPFLKKTKRHLTNSPSAIAPIVFKTVEFLTRYGQGRTFLIFSRQ